jgi:hypothetical protein
VHFEAVLDVIILARGGPLEGEDEQSVRLQRVAAAAMTVSRLPKYTSVSTAGDYMNDRVERSSTVFTLCGVVEDHQGPTLTPT